MSWERDVLNLLSAYHQQYPLRFGYSKEELRSRYFSLLPNKVFNVLLEHWQNKALIKVLDQLVALVKFEPQPQGLIAQSLEKLEEAYVNGKFQPPGWQELVSQLNVSSEQSEELLQFLVARGILVKLEDDMYIHRQALDEAISIIRAFLKENKELQLGQARDLLNSSRKYVLPLLEYMDRNRITRRVGDKRVGL